MRYNAGLLDHEGVDMFCSKCGTQVTDGASFCPKCGNRMKPSNQSGNEVARAQRKSKRGVIVVIAFALIMLAVVVTLKLVPSVLGGFTKLTGMNSATFNAQAREASNNILNDSFITHDKAWLYYKKNQDICKKPFGPDADEDEHTVISLPFGEHLYCVGDRLFIFEGLQWKRITDSSTDGVGFGVFAEDCFQYDGSRYYVNGLDNYGENGVYSVNPDDMRDVTKLSDISPTRILLQGDYLYIMSDFDTIDGLPNMNYGTWRIRKDGTDLIKIFDYCPRYLVFTENKIVFTEYDGTSSGAKSISCADLDGSNKQTFYEAKTEDGLNVSDEYIFYIDPDSMWIYRMEMDGSDRTCISHNVCDSLCVIDDYIYYKRGDSREIHRLSFDGSHDELFA